MILQISWAVDLSRSGTVWFRSGMVPSCHINYQNFGEFMFGKIIRKNVQLLIGLIPSNKESPNFWRVISQIRTTLYWNHIVPDRQGSAAHGIPIHWISPTLQWNTAKIQPSFNCIFRMQHKLLNFHCATYNDVTWMLVTYMI